MNTLRENLDKYPTWGLGFRANGMSVCGPFATFAENVPELTVTLLPADFEPGERVQVAVRRIEEWRGLADMTYYRFADYDGMWNGAGKNWVLWMGGETPRHFFVTAAADAARDWVHVRFILRHFNIARSVSRFGNYCAHAVIGTLPGMERGVLIAGARYAGKTFLLNELLRRGVLQEMVEDDCAVFTPDWRAVCLLPQKETARTARIVPLAAIVCLDATATELQPLVPEAAVVFLEQTPTPWPCEWLPEASARRAQCGFALPNLPCFQFPPRAVDFLDLEQFIRALS